MFSFEVKDMTCGHCVATITKAVQAADHEARVMIDLGRHLVSVEPTTLDADQLHDLITEAGYTPVPVGNPAAPGAGAADPAQRH